MKNLLLLVSFLLLSVQVSACPLCNIHRYLFGSISHANPIFTATVIDTISEYKSKVIITELIRDDSSFLHHGDTIEVSVYPSMKTIGESYIFATDLVPYGPSYEILPLEYLWEVHYINEYTDTVASPEIAMKLVNCISRTTVGDGIDYVAANYDICFPLLTQQLIQLRQSTFSNPDYTFAEYKIMNHVRAIVQADNDFMYTFMMDELDTLLYFSDQVMIQEMPYRGETPKGEYLRYVLEFSLHYSKKLYHSAYKKCNDFIESDTTENLAYVSYAMAFDPKTKFDYGRFSAEKKNYISKGLIWAFMQNQYWRQRDETERLSKPIEQFTSDSALLEYYTKHKR